MAIKDLSKVRLTTLDGDLTDQGIHLCIAYARALRAGNQLRQQTLMSIVKNQYKQPSFIQTFNEIKNDKKLRDEYAGEDS